MTPAPEAKAVAAAAVSEPSPSAYRGQREQTRFVPITDQKKLTGLCWRGLDLACGWGGADYADIDLWQGAPVALKRRNISMPLAARLKSCPSASQLATFARSAAEGLGRRPVFKLWVRYMRLATPAFCRQAYRLESAIGVSLRTPASGKEKKQLLVGFRRLKVRRSSGAPTTW